MFLIFITYNRSSGGKKWFHHGVTFFTPRRNDIFRMMERFKISTPGTKS